MRRSFSRRCYPLLLLGSLNLTAGLLLRRPEAVLVALPFLVLLLLDVWRSTPPHLQLRYRISPTTLCEGESVQATLEITATTTVPLLEVMETLAPGFTCVDGQHGALLTLEAGATQQLTYTARAQQRGRWSCGTILLRSHSPGGLVVYDGQWSAAQTCTVYPQLTLLRRAVAPRHTQLYSGDTVSRHAGVGVEFSTLRPYVHGDAMRHINWRASLRRRNLHVNQYAQERNADVVLLLDTLTAAGSTRVNTLDYCVRAAASLAVAYVRRRDRVGLIQYSGASSWVPPASGRRHLARLLDSLALAQVHLSYVRHDLSRVPPRILPPQALVVALSPLIDPRFVAVLEDLAGRSFEVLLLAISPAAVLTASARLTPLDVVTCQWWELEHQMCLTALRRLGMAVHAWQGQEPLAVVMQRVLHGQRRRGGQRW